MSDDLHEKIRELRGVRDVCARDIADRVAAGDTENESFATTVRLYRKLNDELSEAEREIKTVAQP